MREIKFRGKNEINNFIYGDLVHYESGDTAIFEKRMTKYGYEATDICRRTKVDKDTIGQFTGLYDKNGKEIYEGDILKVPSLDPFGLYEEDLFTTAKVSFLTGSFVANYNGGCQKIHICSIDDKDIEVIGNIYDNKELLEE